MNVDPGKIIQKLSAKLAEAHTQIAVLECAVEQAAADAKPGAEKAEVSEEE